MVARELLNASQSHLLNQDQADASQANNRSGTLAGQHQEQGHQPGPGGGAFRTNVPEFVPRSTESGAGVTAEGGAYRAPLEFRPENRREQQGGSNASLPANGGGIGNYSQGYQMNGSGTTGYNSAKSVSSTAMKGTGEGPAGSHAVADNRNSKLQSSSRQGQGQGQGQQQHEFSGTSKGGPGGNDGNGNGKGGSSMNKGVPSASSKGTSNGKMNVEQMGGSASRYSDSPSRYNNPAAGDRSPYNQQLNGTGPTTSSSSRGGKMNSKGTSKGGYNAYDDRGPFGFDGGPRGGYDDDCGGCDRDYMYLSKSRAGPPDKGGSSSSRDKIMTSGGGYMKGGPGNKAAPPKGDIRSTRYPQDYDYPPGADQRITTAWGKSFEKNDMGSAGGGSKGLTGSTGKGKGGGPSSGAKGDTMMKGGLMQPSTSSSKGDGTQPDGGKRITAHKGVEYKHNMVPRNKDLLEEYGHTMSEKPITTLMIRNIPNRYTQKQFIQELDAIGFKNTYNFAYLPIDRSTESSVGYAFVNFRKPSDAVRALQIFGEYRFQRYRNVSSKIGTVSVAHIQGLDNNIKHYKKSVIADEKNSFRPFVLREPPEGSVSPSNKGRRARKHSRKNKNTPAPAEAGAEGDAAGDEEYADAVSVKEDRGDGGEKENPEQEPQETNNEKDASSSSSTPAGSSKKNKNENTAGAGTYDSSTTTDQEQAGATACTSLLASASATAPTEGTTTEGSDKKDKNAASSDPVPASNEDA
ncbi:unnamed protein product [Amoebophrya sp. A25]|nr:unnamed protein product [Amoebophrya sp. A25]|eukprot:GSA25T00003918001.1